MVVVTISGKLMFSFWLLFIYNTFLSYLDDDWVHFNVVFLIQVNGRNAMDNCRLEFQHSLNTKSSAKVVCVLMEKNMADPSKWGGKDTTHFVPF